VMRREVFPQVRVGEPEAVVLQKRTKCVKMYLAILVSGHHNKRQGGDKSYCEVGVLGCRRESALCFLECEEGWG
jgi:hypothetical protein